MFDLTSTLDGWHFVRIDEVSMEKWEKPHFISFLWGFDSLDINTQGGFFSQITRLVEMNDCANFEKKNRRGPP